MPPSQGQHSGTPCCRYGKQAVPLDKVAEDALAYKPARSMQLVGFLAAGQAMRALQLRCSYLVLPDPDDEQHAHALAVLVSAMISKGRHAGGCHTYFATRRRMLHPMVCMCTAPWPARCSMPSDASQVLQESAPGASTPSSMLTVCPHAAQWCAACCVLAPARFWA